MVKHEIKISEVGQFGVPARPGLARVRGRKREIQSGRPGSLPQGMFLCVLPPKGRDNSDDLLRFFFPGFNFLFNCIPFFPFRKSLMIWVLFHFTSSFT